MSIHARFFDTSKRHKRGGVFCLLVVLGSAVFALPSGCIVTDKIEFEDAVNHPIRIWRRLPEDTILASPRNTVITFSATVSDEDVSVVDPSDNPIAGLLEIQVDDWNETILTDDGCSSPTLQDPTDTAADGPPLYAIGCSLALNSINAGADNLIQVRLIVSDLGFTKNQPNPGADTAEVLWIVRVTEDLP